MESTHGVILRIKLNAFSRIWKIAAPSRLKQKRISFLWVIFPTKFSKHQIFQLPECREKFAKVSPTNCMNSSSVAHSTARIVTWTGSQKPKLQTRLLFFDFQGFPNPNWPRIWQLLDLQFQRFRGAQEFPCGANVWAQVVAECEPEWLHANHGGCRGLCPKHEMEYS
jgi:hypothetical protein